MSEQKQKAQNSANIKPEEYDLVILGSGATGKTVSWALAKKGMKTAVIERKYIGGSCPNIACLPSKNVIHSAKAAWFFRHSDEFGISKDNWKIDMSRVRDRKRKMVAGLVDVHLDLYKKAAPNSSWARAVSSLPKRSKSLQPMARARASR